jgi:hypothetical protein
MAPPEVKRTRVRLYGFLWMTKRTYLIIQAVVFAIVLGVLAMGAVVMVREGRWLPDLDPGPAGATLGWVVRQFLIGLFWLGLLIAAGEAGETLVVLRLFAREEALDRAKRSAPDTAPFGPQGLPPPPGPRADTPSITNPEP